MINLKLFSAVPHGACSWYRTQPLKKLYKLDDRIYAEFGTQIEWDKLSGIDLVFFERPESDEIVRAMEKIKSYGIKIWSDYDDDVFNVCNDNPSYMHYNTPKIQQSIRHCMNLSDIITVSTENLKQKFLPYNDNIIVLENGFNDFNLNLNKPIGKNKIIHWRGSTTHRRDILSITNAMVAISQEYKDWYFSFIGNSLEFITDKLINVKYIEEMPVSSYFEFLLQVSLPIQICPLCFNTFNESKSNISWIEGNYIGAVCLAPKMNEWIKPGILNYTDEESFFYQLRQLIEFPNFREQLFKESREYIKENLLLSYINKKRLKIINQLMG